MFLRLFYTVASTTILTGALLSATAAMAEITLIKDQVIQPSVSPILSEESLNKSTLLAASLTRSSIPSILSCIDNRVITADNLSKTRDAGPFHVADKQLPRQSVNDVDDGFGGGTIYYPTDASSCGLLGVIAVIPGYVSYESSIKWLGPRLAAWGFVVITIDTHSIFDNPDSRAEQLSAALNHVLNDDTVGAIVDPTRLGAIGWSMGGGGTLKLATQRSDIRAIVPLAPYYDNDYGKVTTPTLVVSCEFDRIAGNKKYSSVFYGNALGAKMGIEVNNGSHFCPSYRFNERLLSKPIIAWMQRYINDDKRFDTFLCANDDYSSDPRISHYTYANCP